MRPDERLQLEDGERLLVRVDAVARAIERDGEAPHRERREGARRGARRDAQRLAVALERLLEVAEVHLGLGEVQRRRPAVALLGREPQDLAVRAALAVVIADVPARLREPRPALLGGRMVGRERERGAEHLGGSLVVGGRLRRAEHQVDEAEIEAQSHVRALLGVEALEHRADGVLLGLPPRPRSRGHAAGPARGDAVPRGARGTSRRSRGRARDPTRRAGCRREPSAPRRGSRRRTSRPTRARAVTSGAPSTCPWDARAEADSWVRAWSDHGDFPPAPSR